MKTFSDVGKRNLYLSDALIQLNQENAKLKTENAELNEQIVGLIAYIAEFEA